MSERQPYSRVYWTIRSDERLAAVYPDDHHLATWLRLLIAADMAWPAPADIPASVNRKSLQFLVDAGVIEVTGSLFCFHGLDTERGRRRQVAREAAAHRLPTERLPNGDQMGTERSARRDETRRDETKTSRDTAEIDPADTYWSVTGRYPQGKSLTWIDSMTEQFGAAAVERAIAAEHLAGGADGLLGRVQDILRRDARALDRDERAAERSRVVELRKPTTLRRQPETISDEEAEAQAQAWIDAHRKDAAS